VKITELEVTKPSHLRCIRESKCQHIVRTSGGVMDRGKRKRNCQKFATFDIDGTNLCTQHAGESALRYLIKQQ